MGFYGLGETYSNGIALLYTKLFWGKAKLVRLPFYARNKRNITLGKQFSCGYSCRITAGEDVETGVRIGDNCSIGDNCQIEGGGGVIIGNNVLMASRVFITSNSHGSYKGDAESNPEIPPAKRHVVKKKTIIEDNVWIGNNCTILMGVKVGRSAIIGAGSIVTKDVPEKTIVAGNPAKVIRRYDDDLGQWVSAEAEYPLR